MTIFQILAILVQKNSTIEITGINSGCFNVKQGGTKGVCKYYCIIAYHDNTLCMKDSIARVENEHA